MAHVISSDFSSEGAGGFDLSEDPDYVDLSDENRPTKMPERYNRLYDNEWTEAFCELTNVHGMVEQHAIHVLLDILMVRLKALFVEVILTQSCLAPHKKGQW